MPDVEKSMKIAWKPPKLGSKEREKWPKDAFFDSENRRYPYKIKKGGKWVISCKGILAARRRATMNGDMAILSKAERMYDKYCSTD